MTTKIKFLCLNCVNFEILRLQKQKNSYIYYLFIDLFFFNFYLIDTLSKLQPEAVTFLDWQKQQLLLNHDGFQKEILQLASVSQKASLASLNYNCRIHLLLVGVCIPIAYSSNTWISRQSVLQYAPKCQASFFKKSNIEIIWKLSILATQCLSTWVEEVCLSCSCSCTGPLD